MKGKRFTLKEGSSADTLPVNELPVILLGLGHDNHCVYYKDKYKPGMDNIQPTAVWYQKNPAPASVPASALQKGVDGFLGYQVRRRMVVALMQQNQTDGSFYADLAKPYVLDIGAKSIYGEDYPMNMAFTLSGLIRFCSRQRIMPIHFITKLVFDTNSSVPALRFVPYNRGGQVIYLDEATLQPIYATATSDTVADMLRVKELPTQEQLMDAAQAQRIEAQAQVQAQAQAQAQHQQAMAQMQQDMQPQTLPNEVDDILAQAAQTVKHAEAVVAPSESTQPETINSALQDLLQSAGSYGTPA